MKYAIGDRVQVIHPRDDFGKMYDGEYGYIVKWRALTQGYEVRFENAALDYMEAYIYEDELRGADEEETA